MGFKAWSPLWLPNISSQLLPAPPPPVSPPLSSFYLEASGEMIWLGQGWEISALPLCPITSRKRWEIGMNENQYFWCSHNVQGDWKGLFSNPANSKPGCGILVLCLKLGGGGLIRCYNCWWWLHAQMVGAITSPPHCPLAQLGEGGICKVAIATKHFQYALLPPPPSSPSSWEIILPDTRHVRDCSPQSNCWHGQALFCGLL